MHLVVVTALGQINKFNIGIEGVPGLTTLYGSNESVKEDGRPILPAQQELSFSTTFPKLLLFVLGYFMNGKDF